MTYFTDRYFSNGVVLSMYNPIFKKSPFEFLLLPHNTQHPTYWSLSFTHHIYTPTETYTSELKDLDHPYAAYLLFGIKKESYNYRLQVKTTSEFSMGWIGPLAGGEAFQNTMHAHISIAEHVQGWHYQVGNDVCLQYRLKAEKGVFHSNLAEMRMFLEGRLGSPFTDASIGIHFRAGLFENYFKAHGLFTGKLLQAWLFCSGDARFVCYNATLQGGINNPDNPHTLETIAPLIWHCTFGGALQYRSVRLKLAQEVESPHFIEMGWHRWATLSCALII